MKQATIDRLLALNRRFYAEHADAFSATRRTPWPGLERALNRAAPIRSSPIAHTASTPSRPTVLDIGCGNGRALPALRRRFGDSLRYLGVDGSGPLLAIARGRWSSTSVRFEHADFAATAPELALPVERFDVVLLLGVLHCVPSEGARRALLTAAAQRVAPGGMLVLTVWRFDRDPRFEQRCVPAERYAQVAPGIARRELDSGDELLGFGQSTDALRYAHFPTESELARLLGDLPLQLEARFSSDGSGQQLNDYLLLRGS
jgi:SAM-dependent methyltransferase